MVAGRARCGTDVGTSADACTCGRESIAQLYLCFSAPPAFIFKGRTAFRAR